MGPSWGGSREQGLGLDMSRRGGVQPALTLRPFPSWQPMAPS